MADKDDSTQTASKPSKNDEMVATAKGYAIIFGGLFLIYLLGSWDFSITWIVIGFAVWVYRDQTGKTKKQQMKIRSEITNDEKKAIQAHVNDLPSWVYFPDVERAEWLNKIVKRIWPYLDDYVENILKNTVEPSIRESVPSLSFKFVKIDLGNKPLRIGGVKVYTERTKRDEIIMDLDIFYAGDCDMEVSVSKFKAGIEDIQLHGTLRVVMNPLVSVTPLIGGMTIYFLNMPEFDFNMTNLANILDIPGVSGSLRNIIEDQLSNFLVLPNRLVIPMIKNLEVIRLKFPMPQGVLRICVKEAKDLMRKDMAVFSKGSSDPYCVLHVGGQKFRTKTISSNINPVWDDYYEAIVDVPQGQELIVELWDEDTSSKDESLGNLTVDIETIVQKGFIDTWLPLDDAKSGQLHLKLVWLTLSDQVDALEEALEETKRLKALVDKQLASSLLCVKLDSARALPARKKSRKTMGEPHAYCNVSVGQETKKSKVDPETYDPVWEEVYYFLVQNPTLQNLDVEVKDKKSSKVLGTTSISIKRLLSAPDMTMEQPFQLDDSGPNSTVRIRLCLKPIVSPHSKYYGKVPDSNAILSPSKNIAEPTKPTDDLGASTEEDEKLDNYSIESKDSEDIMDNTITSSTAVSEEIEHNGVNNSQVRKRNVNKGSEDHGCGKVQATIRYSSQRNRLIVVIHKAVDLIALNSDHTSDPYIRLYLLPDKSKSGRRKTKVMKDELNPIYDETFEFACNADEIQQRVIDLVVKNSVGVFSQSKTFMGQTYINLSELDLTKATTVWLRFRNSGTR